MKILVEKYICFATSSITYFLRPISSYWKKNDRIPYFDETDVAGRKHLRFLLGSSFSVGRRITVWARTTGLGQYIDDLGSGRAVCDELLLIWVLGFRALPPIIPYSSVML